MNVEELAAKHGDLVNAQAETHPVEHAANHAEHMAYKAVEHHHIMTQRKKDHGYSEHDGGAEGKFRQFGEEQEHGSHTHHMKTFHHALRKVGHASHAHEHYQSGL